MRLLALKSLLQIEHMDIPEWQHTPGAKTYACAATRQRTDRHCLHAAHNPEDSGCLEQSCPSFCTTHGGVRSVCFLQQPMTTGRRPTGILGISCCRRGLRNAESKVGESRGLRCGSALLRGSCEAGRNRHSCRLRPEGRSESTEFCDRYN